MKTKRYLPLIFIALFTIIGCKKSEPVSDTATTKSLSGIYTVGYTTPANDPSTQNAAMWKGGVLTTLSTAPSHAYGITTVGQDVYICGDYTIEPKLMACYWKNGALTSLTDATPSYAKSVAVQGGDVYIAGYAASKAVYWKNGTMAQLNTPGTAASADAIALVGSDIYVAGSYYTADGKGMACYWKNGVFNKLDYNSNSYFARSIAVSGNDIYVAGQATDPVAPGVKTYGVCWKNGALLSTLTTPGVYSSQVYCIAVSGADVYIGGECGDNNTGFYSAVYWKNGNSKTLTSSNRIQAISVQGDDVYLAGGALYGAPNVAYSAATYWKNESRVALHPSTSGVFGMMIVP